MKLFLFLHALNMGKRGHKEESNGIILDEKLCGLCELVKTDIGVTG